MFLFEIKMGSKLFVLRKLYRIVVFEILINFIAKCIQKLNFRLKILPNFLQNFCEFLVVLDIFSELYSIFYNFFKDWSNSVDYSDLVDRICQASLYLFARTSLKEGFSAITRHSHSSSIVLSSLLHFQISKNLSYLHFIPTSSSIFQSLQNNKTPKFS